MKSAKIIGYLGVAALSIIYVLNPTFGVFEILPDNLPWIGNLDEVGFTALLLWSVRGLRQLVAPASGDERQK